MSFSLPLIQGERHACPYLPGLEAQEVYTYGWFVDSAVYEQLMDLGFRRSGDIMYKPQCPKCQKCVPIRIPVQKFQPSESQRRAWRRNQDLVVELDAPLSDDEHFGLYLRYQRHYHAEKEASTREDYERFLVETTIDTVEMRYRLDGELVAVGILDVCPNSLSSVYFYFEPGLHKRSLGVFSALREIEECRTRGLAWWYPGFWVEGCRKMEYKTRYQPHELLWPTPLVLK
jgi:arginine-tRNA-protein transferase